MYVGNDAPTAPTTIYAQPTQIGSRKSGQVEVYQDHSENVVRPPTSVFF